MKHIIFILKLVLNYIVYKCFKDFNENNTFIVDETPETYQENVENSIPIKKFTNFDFDDKELIKCIKYLEKGLFL